MPEIRRVATLDDYQRTAHRHAAWDSLPEAAHLTYFFEHLGSPEEVIAALEPSDVVVAMRERTPFPADVLDRLPNLRLLVTTGPANAAINTAAAARQGILVSGTRATGLASTAELTWGLLHALSRSLPAEDRNLREGTWQQTVGRGLNGPRLGASSDWAAWEVAWPRSESPSAWTSSPGALTSVPGTQKHWASPPSANGNC
ncbi:hypothetical protein ABR737_34135 [Streptomyces sp. Edi2]|uniref:hypothetical protein n=1 Tax=Streptomyces sp. Edi2 TaxID=3162528 RepID=UPI0033062951